jgi:hypothetical protein
VYVRVSTVVEHAHIGRELEPEHHPPRLEASYTHTTPTPNCARGCVAPGLAPRIRLGKTIESDVGEAEALERREDVAAGWSGGSAFGEQSGKLVVGTERGTGWASIMGCRERSRWRCRLYRSDGCRSG